MSTGHRVSHEPTTVEIPQGHFVHFAPEGAKVITIPAGGDFEARIITDISFILNSLRDDPAAQARIVHYLVARFGGES